MHRIRLLVALAVASALVTGCAGAADPEGQPAPSEGGAAFPVTVDHRFGAVTIPEEPERVVALGFTEQDAILAFGVVPVGVRYAFGPEDDAFFPWADEIAGDASPAILPREDVDPEAVAALRPDLIMAVTAGLDRAQYDVLSRIAPVVVPPQGHIDFGVPWQEQTRITGRALGQPERAEEIVAEVEGEFARVRSEHPQLAGRSVVLSGPAYDGQYPVHAGADTRTRFFGELGMVVPPAIDAAAGDQFYAYLSREQAGMLDGDVVAFQVGSPAERAGIESDPVLAAVPAVAEGRTLWIEGSDYDALQFASPLSLPYLLDGFVPKLAASLG
ncbi:ABC transporter substrate-binding protein [Pseudonocardia sp. NPDC046786]|uniref:ABC transporter substrate-binding protein n=1 Tax=Pseudonocardia sp. NPDC046786 TaxID=3155471 RepID=UPI0033E75584